MRTVFVFELTASAEGGEPLKNELKLKENCFDICQDAIATSEAKKDAPAVEIYTAETCKSKAALGGWGALIFEGGGEGRPLFGGEAAVSHNRMELQAVIIALEDLKEPRAVTLYSSSEYLRKGIARYQERGWKTKSGECVKNLDLWLRLDAAASRHIMTWKWLGVDSGDAMNARAYTLAYRGLSVAKKAAKKAAAKERARQVRAAKRQARAAAMKAVTVQMTAFGTLAVALT